MLHKLAARDTHSSPRVTAIMNLNGARRQGAPPLLVARATRMLSVTSNGQAGAPDSLPAADSVTAGEANLPLAVRRRRGLPDPSSACVLDLQTRLMVDKTALLARILSNDAVLGTPKFLVATAPRRFGKTFVITQLEALARWNPSDAQAFEGYAVRAGYDCQIDELQAIAHPT